MAFCYSINSDLAMLLRSHGIFSTMMIRHDLKIITGNTRARLNNVQRDLMKEIG